MVPDGAEITEVHPVKLMYISGQCSNDNIFSFELCHYFQIEIITIATKLIESLIAVFILTSDIQIQLCFTNAVGVDVEVGRFIDGHQSQSVSRSCHLSTVNNRRVEWTSYKSSNTPLYYEDIRLSMTRRVVWYMHVVTLYSPSQKKNYLKNLPIHTHTTHFPKFKNNKKNMPHLLFTNNFNEENL